MWPNCWEERCPGPSFHLQTGGNPSCGMAGLSGCGERGVTERLYCSANSACQFDWNDILLCKSKEQFLNRKYLLPFGLSDCDFLLAAYSLLAEQSCRAKPKSSNCSLENKAVTSLWVCTGVYRSAKPKGSNYAYFSSKQLLPFGLVALVCYVTFIGEYLCKKCLRIRRPCPF